MRTSWYQSALATLASDMRDLVDELADCEDKLREGGGAAKTEKQHRDGKLTARERIARLLDAGSLFSRLAC